MREDLGDLWIGAKRFAVDDDRYSDLPQTTWLDLKEQMWVRPDNYGGLGFKLTGWGLIAAMKRTGELGSTEHKDRCVRLRATLAGLNKGRELQGTRTDIYELAAHSGLADNWIDNAIVARFLTHEWPHQYVDVESDGREIRISANFGSNRLFGQEAGPLLPIPDFKFPKRS